MNTPNKLTIARMILVPFFVLFILCVTREWVHPVPCRTRQLSPHAPMVLRFASRESRSSPVSLFFSSFFCKNTTNLHQ